MSEIEEKQDTASSGSEGFVLDINEDLEIFLEFLSETSDHLEESESNILSIEDDSSDLETINAIFRSIHSIKGSAGFLGLTDMQRLSHELETLLDKARKSELIITQEIISISLDSIDLIRKLRDNLAIMVDKAQGKIDDSDSSPKEQTININPLIDRIKFVLASSEDGQKPKGPEIDTSADAIVPAKSIQAENTIQKTEVSDEPYLGEILVNNGAVTQDQLYEALSDKKRKVGEILVDSGKTTSEKINEAANGQKQIGEILVEKGEITKSDLDEAIKDQKMKVGELLVKEGKTSQEDVDTALKSQQQAKLQSRTVKVDTAKLDNLFDLVGELVISNTLVSGEMKTANNKIASKNLAQLGKITKDIQDQVMSMRMVPLKQTFQKMSRLVRDVSLNAGKKIKLVISGEDTELDKNVIEIIADPLVHILRNSVDHGVEPGDERVAIGKSREGTIKLDAFHRGGNIVIEVEDDGKGLQKEKILAKALEKGLISDQAGLSDNQIFSLIFLPGFSTAEKVTNISGRGVGMDVVKKNIDKLRGKVEITSQEGKGTLFTIKLPLTLAIIDGIVVKVGNTKYIIPTISIEESLRPKIEELSTVKDKGEVINMRGNLFPLVRLHKLFNIETKKTNPWEAIVVIVEAEHGRYGLLVDELLGQQQVVIKSLGEKFKNVKGISGGAILGDGRVGLILDVSGIRDASIN